MNYTHIHAMRITNHRTVYLTILSCNITYFFITKFNPAVINFSLYSRLWRGVRSLRLSDPTLASVSVTPLPPIVVMCAFNWLILARATSWSSLFNTNDRDLTLISNSEFKGVCSTSTRKIYGYILVNNSYKTICIFILVI